MLQTQQLIQVLVTPFENAIAKQTSLFGRAQLCVDGAFTARVIKLRCAAGAERQFASPFCFPGESAMARSGTICGVVAILA
jgi:hypothetical protein